MTITQRQKEQSKLTVDEWREYTKTVWSIANTSHELHPAVFPEEIPARLIKMFSFVGETVADPFGGTCTTGFAAKKLLRHSICYEQNAQYVAVARKRLATVNIADVNANVVRGDCRHMTTIPDNSVGLAVTSPPYWDKAAYGAGANNLGNFDNYAQFLEEIKPAFQESFRILAPGRKFCIVTANVNQHTEHGLLTFPLAADFIKLCQGIGFMLVNEIIWSKDGTGGKWGSSGQQRPIFGSYPYPPNFLFKNVHEYVIVLAKPNGGKTKGKTVKNYQSLITLPVKTLTKKKTTKRTGT